MANFLLESIKVDDERLNVLIQYAKDYAISKGICIRVPTMPLDSRVPVPFCLFPTAFPKKWFEHVQNLQIHINYVLHKISNSFELLKDCLSSSLESDQFIKNLFDIYEAVHENQQVQLQLGIIRSDYMLNCSTSGEVDGIKQVEINTIAAGLCGISPKMKDLYIAIFEKLRIPELSAKLPHNNSCSKIAEGMISAWEYYNNKRSVVLFVVAENCFNVCDQREIEFKILEMNRNVHVLRYTFKELRGNIRLQDKVLYVNNNEVSVVYFRIGYKPEHYEAQDWETRLLIEQSLSIKCPSVGLQLAGTKSVQQFLTRKGVLEKFLTPDVCANLRQVFARQFFLKDTNSSTIADILEHPEMYVLKTEREGGGNNMYGEEIRNYLQHSRIDNNLYILMDRIMPPGFFNCIVKSGCIPKFCKVTSELGIFGVILGIHSQTTKSL